jgi:hypothetical protein
VGERSARYDDPRPHQELVISKPVLMVLVDVVVVAVAMQSAAAAVLDRSLGSEC